MHITPANDRGSTQVQELTQQVQQATGKAAKLTFADQGYTGNDAVTAESNEGIELQVVKLPQV